MKSNTTCPEPDELRQLLDGTLSGERQKECTEHMDSCECCQSRIEGIATEGTNLSQVVESLHESVVPSDSGYWQAAKMVEQAVEKTFVPTHVVRRRGVSLNFLDPATDSAYLGRMGHFDVMRVIGRGGMGVVLEAFDTHLQRHVALKVLDPELVEDKVSRERFCREARAAARVTHENVVAVHHVEKYGEGALPYLVMQLIPGESLEQRLTREKTLSVREIVRISVQVAHGLGAAYGQGLIHRDIKPGNILLEEGHDSVKLTDFGLARVAEDVRLTRTGFVSGTPLYMAPEQAMGDEADHRSDLFSLGAIMYEMCAGQPPFEGNSALAILKQIADTKHKPLREVNPNTPEWLADTIDRLLAKNPDDRIQSATLLAELLEFQLALMKTSEDVPTVCRIESARIARRNRRITMAVGGALLAVGLVAGYFIANRPSKSSSATTVPVSNVPAVTQPLAILPLKEGTVWSVAMDPSSDTVAMSLDSGLVLLWDRSTKEINKTLEAHRGVVWSSAFTNKGDLFATSGEDGLIKIWKPPQTEPVKTFGNSGGPSASVRSFAWAHDDKTLFAGDRSGALKIWALDSASDKPVMEVEQSGAISAVAVSPDDDVVATASSDKIIRLWNAKDLTKKLELRRHAGSVYGLAFSPDGTRLASGGWDKQVNIWDVKTGEPIKSWDGLGDDIWGVAFSPDGKRLATYGHDGIVRLWNPETAELLVTFHGHKTAVHALTFSRDGKLMASGGREGTVRIWDVAKESW